MLFRRRRRHAAAESKTKSDAATLARSTALQSDELTCAMTHFDASIDLRTEALGAWLPFAAVEAVWDAVHALPGAGLVDVEYVGRLVPASLRWVTLYVPEQAFELGDDDLQARVERTVLKVLGQKGNGL